MHKEGQCEKSNNVRRAVRKEWQHKNNSDARRATQEE